MISRRLIRIKVLQILYAYFSSDDKSLQMSEKELNTSISKYYDLYHLCLSLFGDIAYYAHERIEISRNKHIKTHEDQNPNMRFVENKVIEQLSRNEKLQGYCSTQKINWRNSPELIKNLYEVIVNSDDYQRYMMGMPVPDVTSSNKLSNSTYDADRNFLYKIISETLPESEFLEQELEEISIYWNDEIELALSMAIRTIKDFTPSTTIEKAMMPLFKNEDDKVFGKSLLRSTILNKVKHREIIDKYTQNWDVERIAIIDIILLQMAMAEIFEFPSIPIRVTMNEYIDLAKYYSTNKSGHFINGVLDKIVADFRKDNLIHKEGRGLVGD